MEALSRIRTLFSVYNVFLFLLFGLEAPSTRNRILQELLWILALCFSNYIAVPKICRRFLKVELWRRRNGHGDNGHEIMYKTTLQKESKDRITINVPVVFMARYVMVLRGATSLRGALEGVGPENRDFFGPWNGRSKASAISSQKSRDFQGPPLPMPRVMMLHPSKPLRTSAMKTTGTLVVLCTRVLLCSVVVCCV